MGENWAVLTPSRRGSKRSGGGSMGNVMKPVLLAAAFVGAAVFSTATSAAEVTARDPKSVLTALADLGFKAELKTGTDGASSISLTIDGSPSSITFYNCDDDETNCETLLFAYGMNFDDGVAVEKANEWNATTIHGFVFTDDEADPWLNMVVMTGAGISSELFGDYMSIWRARIGAVRDFFDF